MTRSDSGMHQRKKQVKEYADKRGNAQESSIVIGHTVLLKQNRADMLTPAYDPSPYSVIGVKGTMVAVKRGREIKARDSSHCQVLKYIREKEYDLLYWVKMALVMPKQRRELRWMCTLTAPQRTLLPVCWRWK